MKSLIEPPLHRPRSCPACRAESRAIVAGRCLRCRTDPAEVPAIEASDAEWIAATRERFNLPWTPAPQPPKTVVPRSPARCGECCQAKWTVVDGHCMACRASRGLDARPC